MPEPLVTAVLADQLVEARARLAALRRDFLQTVDASRDSNADDEHDPEGATIAFERSQLAALVEQAERQVAQVEAAVARLDGGQYGTCATCGRAIDPARLQARPSADTCIDCARLE